MVSGFDHDQSGATGSVMQLVFPLPHLQLSFFDNLLLYDPFFQNPCSSPSSLGLSPLRSPLWELVRANGFDGDSHHQWRETLRENAAGMSANASGT